MHLRFVLLVYGQIRLQNNESGVDDRIDVLVYSLITMLRTERLEGLSFIEGHVLKTSCRMAIDAWTSDVDDKLKETVAFVRL
ncbi:hypothetical protein TWF730_005760 [Orbilia blumenaviensis]|uniref:Uncharacterized protein n=1 Tax=Orbilia blumenaviensis TaxID=1796055 RepID=A0AAV9VJB9_9PEZI